jgi:stage V sporulation protein B
LRRAKKGSYVGGIVTLLVSQILVKLIGVVYKIYITNKEGFGDEGNAIYSGSYQIYALLLTLSSIGVPAAISKLVSERITVGDRRNARRIFKIALLTYGIIGLIGTMALIFGSEFISTTLMEIPDSRYTLVALAPAIFFVSISSIIRGYFNGMQNMKATAYSQTLEQIFKTVFTIVAVEIAAFMWSNNTTYMAVAATVATTLATVLSFAYLYLFLKFSKEEETGVEQTRFKRERFTQIIKQILVVSIPIAFTAMLTTINKNIDMLTVVRRYKKVC